MKQIITVLTERGYTEKEAIYMAEKLSKLDVSLQPGLQKWLKDKSMETDYIINGVTLSELQHKFKMTYPAALLTMDWVIRDPERAIKSINKGIR